MSQSEILVKLINSALEVESINEYSKLGDIPEWDSLGQLAILSALDERLEGRISHIRDFVSAKSVHELMNLLNANNLSLGE